ncbi:sulfotransferase family 2 domain-containing protein [Novosphingobium profundi]|uniref:sulfotransferase family 2 domain-containing protein n=1 Tax=Novosphingobium profundi TaxID=1774954 RepID=UPI001BD9C378|nr:sulfotransferase family 2 domain-containing protein [Novosphingobium profundi]MBT0667275.1 sulfotransferase family 2 domain-containing protein [Novosphingobium profundi]
MQAGKSGLNKVIASSLGVRLVSDVPERMARWPGPTPIDAKRRRMIEAIRERGILFIHVPKNAGTSICETLYGLQVKHSTVDYYRQVAPDVLALPSFAILRDPVERFVSAFHYASAGGTRDRQVATPFRARYARFESFDCAIRHMEKCRDLFAMDHMFRPQSWYVTKGCGTLGVDHLICYDQIDRIREYAGLETIQEVPCLNSGRRAKVELTARQKAFVRDFYRDDYALIAATRN